MRSAAARLFGIAAFCCAAVACGAGGADEADVIEREAFVETYIALREAALQSPTRRLTDAERERILAEQGVTEDDLLRFAEVRGADPEYMVELWTDISARVNPPPDPAIPSSGVPPDSSSR